ncbi:hypothetical protein CAMSH0001_0373 [Campylobacter showae RM3277]|uniref:Uncharacterized protein n=1 Tax=Campylobacter showae RM3277 TaxID=553219 RepID=C6RF69_9BACT|nr:hypothetical protein CAMSH0001_0373 [Campylobacter showae RM3277]
MPFQGAGFAKRRFPQTKDKIGRLNFNDFKFHIGQICRQI